MSTDYEKLLAQAQEEIVRLKTEVTESRQNYENIFENAGDSIFIVDFMTRLILDANSHAARRLGYTMDELIGMTLEELEVNIEGPNQMSWESSYSGTQVYECYYRHKSGKLIPFEVSSRIIQMGQQDVIQNFARNIIVRKQIEAEREQFIKDLDNFAHMVAHDLKNPLSTISGYLYILDQDAHKLTEAELREFIQDISFSTKQAVSIVDELLLFAGVRNQENIDLKPLDMGLIVQEVSFRFASTIEKSQARIILPESWHPAIGYAPWVKEIWANYLSNAIKYGGKPPVIELGSTREPNNMVRFWVRDNGIGIAPDTLPKIFDMFSRFSGISIEGHGLGLSIVKRIAEKLNGYAEAKSAIGEGSTFSFVLPME